MAKKLVKSILQDVSEVPHTTPPLVETDVLKIDEVTLLRMTRYMEKERAARMELQVSAGQMNGLFQVWLRDSEEGKKLNARMLELQDEQRSAQQKYQEIVADVGKRLKVNLADYSFDDETGVLHPLTPSTPSAPDNVTELKKDEEPKAE